MFALFAAVLNYAEVEKSLPDNNDYVEIYLIKTAWHVGILVSNDSLTSSILPIENKFVNFDLIDIGWGDEDFYQSEDVNYFYALKAALFPTSSVLKLTGYSADISSLVRWSDYAIKIKLGTDSFVNLLKFISASFAFEEGKIIETSSKAGGVIKFYKSSLSYSIAYTCNTWVADALNHAGLLVDPDEVITSQQLFFSVAAYGEILK
jgi:hypothetical protein